MESTTLTLKDIYIGNTDAKNELLYNNTCEIEQFTKNFVIPPSLLIENFKNKNKYFITGLKGTGKTALLRYVDIKMSGDDVVSSFILFKSDIDEDTKKKISQLSRIEVCKDNSSEYDNEDFEVAWRWFIYKNIISNTSKCNSFFCINNEYKEFKAIISAVDNDGDSFFCSNIFPKIKKGMINFDIKCILNLGINIEFEEKSKSIKFASLVKKLDEYFCKLTITKGRMNLFFDELELNYNTNKQYNKDARLIRDLIVSIEKINAVAKKNKMNICLYAGIRSEVLNTVESLGKEINKPISDFGIEILWNRPGVTAIQQPLLNIIEQRINNARRDLSLEELDSNTIWEKYFPSKILNREPFIYILHNSWYRPRDIIRLLKIAQEQFPDATFFSQSVLEPIRKKYSLDSWVEMSEELKSKYTSKHIDAIKNIFYGYIQISSLSQLKEHIKQKIETSPNIKELIDYASIEKILSDLYRVGIIGNINRTMTPYRMRFAFRGDAEILLNQEIYLHNALLAHLSV